MNWYKKQLIFDSINPLDNIKEAQWLKSKKQKEQEEKTRKSITNDDLIAIIRLIKSRLINQNKNIIDPTKRRIAINLTNFLNKRTITYIIANYLINKIDPKDNIDYEIVNSHIKSIWSYIKKSQDWKNELEEMRQIHQEAQDNDRLLQDLKTRLQKYQKNKKLFIK